MAFEVTFELKESDLEYFRDVMRQSRLGGKNLTEAEIIVNAKILVMTLKLMCRYSSAKELKN
ncbi:hypothetical protein [Colwellia sp. C1TZA3]|uniref:hypothetical protein n=1 Tax=Colwellia sp. C1TZA3 TaxID=2508879 RepID=UPI001CB9C8D6|nr:hypothetical protein [Colwellia sp. C1TZA3]